MVHPLLSLRGVSFFHLSLIGMIWAGCIASLGAFTPVWSATPKVSDPLLKEIRAKDQAQRKNQLVGHSKAGSKHSAKRRAKRTPKLAPTWSRDSWVEWDPNLSYWMPSSLSELGKKKRLEEGLMDPGRLRELRQEYLSVSFRHETQLQADPTSTQLEETHRTWAQELSKKVWAGVRDYQRQKGVQKVKDIVQKNQSIARPAGVAIALAAVSTGTPVQASLAPETHVTAYANFPHRVSYLQWGTPVVGGAFTLSSGSAPGVLQTLVEAPPDWIRRDERYSVSLTRGIPKLGLDGKIQYGNTSGTLTASMTKALWPNLACTVEKIYPVGPTLAANPLPVQSLTFRYELHF